jgi:hypothetical protein
MVDKEKIQIQDQYAMYAEKYANCAGEWFEEAISAIIGTGRWS